MIDIRTIKINHNIVIGESTFLEGDFLRLPRVVTERIDNVQKQLVKRKKIKEGGIFNYVPNNLGMHCRLTPDLVTSWLLGRSQFDLIKIRQPLPIMIKNELERRAKDPFPEIATPENDLLAKVLAIQKAEGH